MSIGAHINAVLLPIAAAVLLEELTFGGLVRLLLAPWPENRKRAGHTNRKEGRKWLR
jgi:hypothetical protein